MAGKLDDFLNPNSMLTPGIAGGLATTIAMPLAFSFGWKIPLLVLAVSFLLSLLIVSGFDAKIPWTKRSIYCVLNTLIIFSASIGAARQIDQPPQPPEAPPPPAAMSSGVLDVLIPSAQAQLQKPPRNVPVAPRKPAAAPAPDQAAAQAEELAKLRAQVKEMQDYQLKRQEYERQTAEYNRRWKF